MRIDLVEQAVGSYQVFYRRGVEGKPIICHAIIVSCRRLSSRRRLHISSVPCRRAMGVAIRVPLDSLGVFLRELAGERPSLLPRVGAREPATLPIIGDGGLLQPLHVQAVS
jgi:hypothetical protein